MVKDVLMETILLGCVPGVVLLNRAVWELIFEHA
jgi:hypothetical protein